MRDELIVGFPEEMFVRQHAKRNNVKFTLCVCMRVCVRVCACVFVGGGGVCVCFDGNYYYGVLTSELQ